MAVWSRILVLICCIQFGLLSVSNAACKTVEVRGTFYNGHLEGEYGRRDPFLSCGWDKPVWKLNDYYMPQYIYYIGTSRGWGWMVGPHMCGNHGGMKADDPDGKYTGPDEFPGIWEESYYGASWEANSNIRVTCKDGLPLSARVAIGVMCSLFVIVILILITYRCWKKKDTSSANSQSNNASTVAARVSLPPPIVSSSGEEMHMNMGYSTDFALPSYTEAPPSYEDVVRSYSHPPNRDPHMALSVNIPSGEQARPNVEHAVPGVHQQVLDVHRAVPDVNRVVPDIRSVVPDVNRAVPDVRSTVPDVSSMVPNVDPPPVITQQSSEQGCGDTVTMGHSSGGSSNKEQDKDMVVCCDSVEGTSSKPAEG